MEVLTASVRELAKNKPVKPAAALDVVVDPAGELAAETHDEQARASSSASNTETPKITTDIQAILTVIGHRKWAAQEQPHQRLDLSGAYLNGADLKRANLQRAFLFEANFSKAMNLTWHQVSAAIIDDETKLPPEIENQHKDELKALREKPIQMKKAKE